MPIECFEVIKDLDPEPLLMTLARIIIVKMC